MHHRLFPPAHFLLASARMSRPRTPLRLLPVLSVIGSLLMLTQCSSPEARTEVRRAEGAGGTELFPVPLSLNIPKDAVTLNDAARFLAGMPALSGRDSFRDLRATSQWQAHASKMDGLWNDFTARHGQPVSSWASSELGDLRGANAVFYPFSGPDFLFAHLFFPRAETYLLCGLEPCSPLPEWPSLTPQNITDGCDGLYDSLDNILQFSYFITKEMRSDLQSTRFRGVLPVFMVFLARTGHHVDSIEAVKLDDNGNPFIYATSQTTPPGLLIRYSGQGGSKRIFYFAQDLSNASCRPGGPFLRFAASLGQPAALAKSASYLMHESSFSNIRNHVLTQCRGIVQDPSGIPYSAFASSGWKTQLYGNYIRTIDVFNNHQQPDLAAAYATGGGKPINFGIGYLVVPETTSLMVARP